MARFRPNQEWRRRSAARRPRIPSNIAPVNDLVDRLMAPIERFVVAAEQSIARMVAVPTDRTNRFRGRLGELATARRLRAWSLVLIAGFWLPALAAPAKGFWDFSEFYTAGRLVGGPALMNVLDIVRLEESLGLSSVPFVYTPALAWLFVPASGLSYALAGWLVMASMLVLLMLAVEIGRRVLGLDWRIALVGALAWPPAAVAVVTDQTSTLGLLLMAVACVGLVKGGKWELLTGLAVAGLAYKLPLALPLLGLLVLRWKWKALAAACAGLAVVYLLSVAATGGDWSWPGGWLASANQVVALDTVNQWQSISLTETLGGSPFVYAGLALLGLALLPGLRARPIQEAVAVGMVAGLVISPHALFYDATLALPAIAMLGRRSIPLYILAGIWPLGYVIGFQPLAFGLAIWLVSETRLIGRREAWAKQSERAASLPTAATATA